MCCDLNSYLQEESGEGAVVNRNEHVCVCVCVCVCLVAGWLNWPHLAQFESGGWVGLWCIGQSVHHKLSQPPTHTHTHTLEES